MTSEHSSTDDDDRVVRFRPRGTPRWRWPVVNVPQRTPPLDDLAKFERGDGEEDYRQRMRMNAIALATTFLLVIIGVWLANTISEMVKVQDCYLSGRRNCAPIDTGPTKQSRWDPATITLGLSGNVEGNWSKS